MAYPSQAVRNALNHAFAPREFIDELAAWVEFGELPDNEILNAIIKNDLHAVIAFQGSWQLARETLRALPKIEPKCFGSAEAVRAWARQGGMDGRMRRARSA